MHLRKETCYECEKHLRYMESSPAKQMGVTMHMGERFCTGGKRARKFKRNDPKIYVPSWCPKRKIPSELRVYCFKSTVDWMLHERLCYDLGKEVSPEAHRYADIFLTEGEPSENIANKRVDIIAKYSHDIPVELVTVSDSQTYEVFLSFNSKTISADGYEDFHFVIDNEDGEWKVFQGLSWAEPYPENPTGD